MIGIVMISSAWFKLFPIEPFEYKIYMDDKWISPWEMEDLYNSVYEILHKLEVLAGYINVENQAESDEEENGIDA